MVNFASIEDSMLRQFSVRRAYGRGDEFAAGFGVFCDVNSIAREFFGKRLQESLRILFLLFAATGESQQNLPEGLQIMAIVRSLLDLLHPQFLIAMNTTEPQHH